MYMGVQARQKGRGMIRARQRRIQRLGKGGQNEREVDTEKESEQEREKEREREGGGKEGAEERGTIQNIFFLHAASARYPFSKRQLVRASIERHRPGNLICCPCTSAREAAATLARGNHLHKQACESN
jgi:hypothetical protein